MAEPVGKPLAFAREGVRPLPDFFQKKTSQKLQLSLRLSPLLHNLLLEYAIPTPPPSPKSPLCYGVSPCYGVNSFFSVNGAKNFACPEKMTNMSLHHVSNHTQ